MAEVQSRPSAPRGRGSGRGGRGGHSSRGGTRSTNRQSTANATDVDSALSFDEQGEIGQLKKKYMSQMYTLKELFPDWTDDDLVFALEETDGDLQSTIERITDGTVSRFADVKKKTREKSRSKVADDVSKENDRPTGSVRGRGRGGLDGGRGGRGRGSTDRGRTASRGRGGAGLNGARSSVSNVQAPVTATAMNEAVGGWDTGATATTEAAAVEDNKWDSTTGETGWGTSAPESASVAPVETGKSSIIPSGTKKTWASMLAKSKPPPAVPMPAATKTANAAPTTIPSITPEGGQIDAPDDALPVPDAGTPLPQATGIEDPETAPSSRLPSESGADLTPPRDPLTENNVEHLPDTSKPQPTETVASTRDARSTADSATPPATGTAQQQLPISRPPMGGYATTAWKATSVPGRSASFQRRMMNQQEAVVMPANHAVDRTAVQFGSLGLGSEQDSHASDVDEDREDAQTRAQPPAQSPTAPRASLPPVSNHPAIPQETIPPENVATPKQAPGLPHPVPQIPSGSTVDQPLSGAGIPQAPGLGAPYARYGGGLGQEPTAPSEKAYDAFGQPSSQAQHPPGFPQSHHDQSSLYPSHSQGASSISHQAPSHLSGYPQDYASQYGQEHQRNSFQGYYGNYGQQQATSSSMQEGIPPGKTAGGLAGVDSGLSGSGSQTLSNQSQSRFGDPHNSGHNTPNPPLGSHHSGGHSQHMHQHQQQQQQQPGQGGHGGYPYQYGYGNYSYNAYMNQYPSQYGQYNQGFSAPYGGKGGMYGQHHPGYNMGHQSSYDQSPSPAANSGFASSAAGGRDSMYSGGFSNEYSRSGSTQPTPSSIPSSTNAGFGGLSEGYGRSASGGFGGHQNQFGQPSTSSAEESSLKGFHESKSGPSPSLGGVGGSQPGRPGSAINTAAGPGSNQGGYGNLSQNQQQSGQGFGGGYPGHLGQLHSSYGGSQHGGLGGLGSGHHHQQSNQSHGYGNNYGGGFAGNYGGSNYGGSYARGWSNYGH